MADIKRILNVTVKIYLALYNIYYIYYGFA
jgi:hypothetical protein